MFEFTLADNMILGERSAYNIVTLIAEVSGFADMFMISAALILTTLYQPKMLQQAIVLHTGSFFNARKSYKVPDISDKLKSNDKDVLKFVILEFRQRFKI